jgi:hypothetical protein
MCVLEVVVRIVSGLILIGAGVALLVVGYSMPSSNNAVEPEQHAEIAVSGPASPALVPTLVSDGWQIRWRAEAVPATEARPTPVVVRLPARRSLPLVSKAAAMPSEHASLARALQQELRRVGCYEGQLDGSWTTLTRRAMQTFNDRVNATLPIGEPNEILLTLVQNQQGRVCGAPCPPGQSVADEGRCMPNAILALAHKKTSPPLAVAQANNPTVTTESSSRIISSWAITATTMTPALPLPGDQERMSLAGPIAHTNPINPLALSAPTAGYVPRSAGPSQKKFGQGFFRELDRRGVN